MTSKTIGIIGLGIMGGAIAANLVKAGFTVIGHDVDSGRRREAEAAGARLRPDAAGVAQEAEILLTSLPTEEALDRTVAAIVAAKLPRRLVAELSTFTIVGKERAELALRQAGHILLDCPLSGTGAQAKVRDLSVYASGDSAAIATLMPVFLGFAREAHDLGAFGNGSKMKYVANLLVAIHNVAAAEALVLGMKAGLDPQAILRVVPPGAGGSRMLEVRGPVMASGGWAEPTMRVSTWHKDLRIIGEYAKAVGCPIPMMDATLPIYAAALRQGHGEHDTAAVCAVLEKMAGVQRAR
jgi:3-hydroxyisobutyrate dehydrogenase-like beta-hydroxyacid dehydrogenase